MTNVMKAEYMLFLEQHLAPLAVGEVLRPLNLKYLLRHRASAHAHGVNLLLVHRSCLFGGQWQ